MRIRLAAILVLFAGCAADPGAGLAGKQAKNGGPIRVERLGTTVLLSTDEYPACPRGRVLWCENDGSGARCRCQHAQRARTRLGLLVGRDPRHSGY
jgi:hypothetical protein